MSDFITRLIDRARGTPAAVRPLLPSQFEPHVPTPFPSQDLDAFGRDEEKPVSEIPNYLTKAGLPQDGPHAGPKGKDGGVISRSGKGVRQDMVEPFRKEGSFDGVAEPAFEPESKGQVVAEEMVLENEANGGGTISPYRSRHPDRDEPDIKDFHPRRADEHAPYAKDPDSRRTDQYEPSDRSPVHTTGTPLIAVSPQHTEAMKEKALPVDPGSPHEADANAGLERPERERPEKRVLRPTVSSSPGNTHHAPDHGDFMSPGATKTEFHALPASSPAPPSIHVTIGRIEVRAVTQQPRQQKRSTPPAPKLSLDDYLKQRSKGKG